MKKTAEIFVENLVELRKAARLRQEDFANKVNLTVRGYQKYEQGESSPTPEVLDRFASVLGCQPWELVAPKKDVAQIQLGPEILATINSTVEAAVKPYLKIIGEMTSQIENLRKSLSDAEYARKQEKKDLEAKVKEGEQLLEMSRRDKTHEKYRKVKVKNQADEALKELEKRHSTTKAK